MGIGTDSGLRRACVLPFEAEPKSIAGLRRVVGRQLANWGASALADDAQLAISELAANVIKHVGKGTAATLVMEESAGRVHIEMHDTSSILPKCRQARPGEEAGRGLALIAAIAEGWFAVSTAVGKAVCCVLAPVGHAPDQIHDRERIDRAMAMVELYALHWCSARPLRSAPAVTEAATDLITDLMCWLAKDGRDPDDILDRAQMHFDCCRKGPDK